MKKQPTYDDSLKELKDASREDLMKCAECGEFFNKANLADVFWHETHKGDKPTHPGREGIRLK